MVARNTINGITEAIANRGIRPPNRASAFKPCDGQDYSRSANLAERSASADEHRHIGCSGETVEARMAKRKAAAKRTRTAQSKRDGGTSRHNTGAQGV